MLEVGFVEHFAPVHLVMMARFVAFAEFVREAAQRVPAHQPRVICAQLLPARVAQFGALRVVPNRCLRIRRIGHRTRSDPHPLRRGAEIQNRGMPLGGFQKIDGERIDQRKVPRGLPVMRRLQFRDGQSRIRQPRHEAGVIRLQIAQRFENAVVDLGSAPQRRVDHHLQRRSGIGNARHRIPGNRDSPCLGGGGTQAP